MSLERRKDRFMAQRFSQQTGIDFNETFARVARLDLIRFLMALAAQHNLVIYYYFYYNGRSWSLFER